MPITVEERIESRTPQKMHEVTFITATKNEEILCAVCKTQIQLFLRISCLLITSLVGRSQWGLKAKRLINSYNQNWHFLDTIKNDEKDESCNPSLSANRSLGVRQTSDVRPPHIALLTQTATGWPDIFPQTCKTRPERPIVAKDWFCRVLMLIKWEHWKVRQRQPVRELLKE